MGCVNPVGSGCAGAHVDQAAEVVSLCYLDVVGWRRDLESGLLWIWWPVSRVTFAAWRRLLATPVAEGVRMVSASAADSLRPYSVE